MESHNQLVPLRGGMNCLAGPGLTICTLLGTSETGFADKNLRRGALTPELLRIVSSISVGFCPTSERRSQIQKGSEPRL